MNDDEHLRALSRTADGLSPSIDGCSHQVRHSRRIKGISRILNHLGGQGDRNNEDFDGVIGGVAIWAVT